MGREKGRARRLTITKRCVIRQGIRGRCNKEYRGQERSCITGYASFAHSSHPWSEPSLKGTSHKPQTTWLEQKTGRGPTQASITWRWGQIIYVMSLSWHARKMVPSLRHQSNDILATDILSWHGATLVHLSVYFAFLCEKYSPEKHVFERINPQVRSFEPEGEKSTLVHLSVHFAYTTLRSNLLTASA